MNNSPISRLSVIAVVATSLLAVGVIAAISMTEEATAISISNSITQSNSATVSQSIGGGGGSCTVCSNSATVSQSNTASQSNTVVQTR